MKKENGACIALTMIFLVLVCALLGFALGLHLEGSLPEAQSEQETLEGNIEVHDGRTWMVFDYAGIHYVIELERGQ